MLLPRRLSPPTERVSRVFLQLEIRTNVAWGLICQSSQILHLRRFYLCGIATTSKRRFYKFHWFCAGGAVSLPAHWGRVFLYANDRPITWSYGSKKHYACTSSFRSKYWLNFKTWIMYIIKNNKQRRKKKNNCKTNVF